MIGLLTSEEYPPVDELEARLEAAGWTPTMVMQWKRMRAAGWTAESAMRLVRWDRRMP